MTPLHIKISFVFLAASMALHSQQDSIPFSEKLTDTTEVKYERLYQQFIAEKEKPINSLWKLDLAGSGVVMPAISHEHKLGKNWSEETYLKLGLPWKDGFFPVKFEWEINQQIKYYYNFNRREKFGKNTNGFSGNYIALEVFAGDNYQPKPGIGSGSIVDRKSYLGTGLKLGMQRRLGTTGFIEPYIGLRLLYKEVKTSSYDITLNSYNYQNFNKSGLELLLGIRAGFALDKIFLPYSGSRENKSLWKFNLADIGFLYSNIGFEHFIWPNLSINTYLSGGVSEVFYLDNNNAFFEGTGSYSPKIKIEQQVRFYLGNTFSHYSGTYAALEVFGELKDLNYRTDVVNYKHIDHDNRNAQIRNYGAGVTIGLQRLIGNNGYVDLFTGLKYEIQEYPVFKPTEAWPELKIITKSHFKPVIGLKAGISPGRVKKIK